MDKFVLEDVREFCLCNLDRINDIPLFKKCTTTDCSYIPTYYRVFVWKILKCNEILNLLVHDHDNINSNELKNKMSVERLLEIWNLTLPIYEKLKEYSSLNFKPSSLYSAVTINGRVKDAVYEALRKTGAHSWTSCISPVTEKFWVAGDFTFSVFYDRISSDTNFPREWWDFHQEMAPEIRDE